jgi:hypothetical protein
MAEPDYEFVPSLPDLIDPVDYAGQPHGRLVRLSVRATEQGVEILGDGLRPAAIEAVLAALDPATIEQMLCG